MMRRTLRTLCILSIAALVALPAAAQQAAGSAAPGTPPAAAKTNQKAAPKGVISWKETLDLAADGSARVGVDLVLANWDADAIDLPLSYAKPEGITVTCPDLTVVGEAGKTGDVKALKLKFDRKPAPVERLRIDFVASGFLDWKKARSPRGFYGFSYTFANLGSAAVGGYTLKVLLPPEYKMTEVLSSTPKATGEEAVPPYDFTEEDGRLAVNLRSPAVGAGKTAAIAFNFEKPSNNAIAYIVVVAAIIAIIALFAKRGVLTDKDYQQRNACA